MSNTVPKRVTIHDVARLAGVSHTTVSWVIHDDKRISPATKEKVQKAIAELNYHPNQVARSLVRGKSNTIAILASFYSSAFEIEIMKGIEQGFDLSMSQYGILQYATRDDPVKKNDILEQIVYGRKADAVICLNLQVDDKMIAAFLQNNVPVILVENTKPQVCSVKSDSFTGGYQATRHLLERGRTRIGIVSGTFEDSEDSSSARDRYAGYVKALEEAGLVPSPGSFIPIRDYYFEEGQEAVKHIIGNNLDGIFCAAGDMVAMGILDGAKKQGLKLPEAFSLVGYDNLIISSLIQPSLTTVSQPLQAMGRQALFMCMEALQQGKYEPVHTVYQPELVIRESS